ncbi:MAG: hypothetical protein AB3N33_05865 [Puniceicoccaceae bacterium]
MAEIRHIDLIVIFIYLGLMLGIGFAFSRFMKGGKEFFVGGNHIPWWAAGVSLYMTTFSAWMFTGAASFVYNTGMFGVLFFAVKPAGFLVGFLLSARRWRRSRVTSPVEYVRTRYNKPTHLFLSIMMILSMMYWPGHHLASLAKICAPTLFPGMPSAIDIMIIAAGIFILVYTISGGFWAVCVTDVVQFIILFCICLVLIPVIFLSGDVGTPMEFLKALPPLEFDHVVRGNTVYNEYYLIGFMVAGVFGNMVGDKAQRFYSVRDEKAAMKVGWLGFALFLTSPILFGVPPLVGLILFPDISELAHFSSVTKPDENIFIAVVMQYLPIGMVGVFLSAMMAASMSALDSVWNTVSSIVSVDIYKGIIKPNATEKQTLLVGRLTIVGLSVIAVVMALLIIHSDLGLFTISNIVLGLFGIPVTIPMVAGLWSRRITRWSGIASILAGVIMATSIRFYFGYSLGVQYLLTIAAGVLFLYTSMPLGMLFRKTRAGVIVLGSVFGLGVFGLYRFLGQQAGADGLAWPIGAALAYGFLVIGFSRWHARDLEKDQSAVDQFFEKLNTPIDPEKELEAEGDDVVKSYSLVGLVTLFMGALCLVILPLADNNLARGSVLGISGLLLLIGFGMYRMRPRTKS